MSVDQSGQADSERFRPHPPAPLLPVALGLVLGITLDYSRAPGRETYIALTLAAALALWACGPHPQIRNLALLLCAVSTGGLLHDAHFRHLPTHHIARFVSSEPYYTTVTGQLLKPPRQLQPGNSGTAGRRAPPRTKFVVQLEDAQTEQGPVGVTGLLEVTVVEPIFDLYGGDRVSMFGKLYKPSPPDNPGQFDWALAKRRQGIHAGLICQHVEAIHKLPAQRLDWRRCLSRLRLEARTLLLNDVLGDDLDKRSLLGTMILGQRSQLSPEACQAFRRTGTSHFLALSGMHVGLLALFIWSLGKLAGLSRHTTAVVIILVLTTYSLLVEPRPSVIRATIISLVFASGVVLRRPVSSLNSISLAATILLICNPLQLFQPGFQLSFVVALSIPYLTPVLAEPAFEWVRRRSLQQRSDDAMSRRIGVAESLEQEGLRAYAWRHFKSGMLRYVVYTFCVCLAAWLAGTPLAAYHFNSFYAYGWPFTALVLPFVFLTMIGGFSKLLLGMIWPSTSVVLGPCLEWSARALVWFVEQLARAPAAAIDVPAPPGWWLVLYYGVLLTVAVRHRPPFKIAARIPRSVPPVIALTTLVTAAGAFLPPRDHPDLRITLLDVGSGSATLLELPDGRALLYDAGSLSGYDVGAMTVLPALREKGIRRIDAAIVSHPNYDHYSGLFSLCDSVGFGEVVIPSHFERFVQPGELDDRFLQMLSRKRIPVTEVDTDVHLSLSDRFGAVQAHLLWPPADLPEDIDSNDTSIVLKLVYRDHSVLLTGDIDRYAIERLLQAKVDLGCDVLVLPHHGSVNSATARLIAAANPATLLVSRGRPISAALAELTRDHRFLSTAEVGAVSISITEDELIVRGFRLR